MRIMPAKYFILFLLAITLSSCNANLMTPKKVRTGLSQICNEKAALLQNKNIALITNHSGIDEMGDQNIHCLAKIKGLKIKKIFSPEHGFQGKVEAGAAIQNSQTQKIPIISLYGQQKAPTLQQLQEIDVLVYDIQDLGVRFYTYISTLGLSMEAAAKANVPFMVLDRPNPLSNSVQGPLLNTDYKSFVGAYPIQTRYGLTVGQLAQQIIKQKWIKALPELTVIPLSNWHPEHYFDQTGLIWVPPSPNIPHLKTALIYPGTCLLEASNISEGRGTEKVFLQFGAPWLSHLKLLKILNDQEIKGIQFKAVTFKPIAIPNKVSKPKFQNQICNGIEIIIIDRSQINSPELGKIILESIYQLHPEKLILNQDFLDKLWGSRLQIKKIL